MGTNPVLLDVDVRRGVAHARSQSIGNLARRSAARDPDKIAIVYRGLRHVCGNTPLRY